MTTDQIAGTIETFLSETVGIVCVDREHDKRFRDARDKLIDALVDLRWDQGRGVDLQKMIGNK